MVRGRTVKPWRVVGFLEDMVVCGLSYGIVRSNSAVQFSSVKESSKVYNGLRKNLACQEFEVHRL